MVVGSNRVAVTCIMCVISVDICNSAKVFQFDIEGCLVCLGSI